MNKEAKAYVKYLQAQGLRVEHGSKHIKVYQGTRLVTTIACTSGVNTYRQNTRHLVANGVLPAEAKRIKW